METNQKPTISEISNDADELQLNWTWYLLVGSCFLLLLGFAISWILIKNEIATSVITRSIPVVICTLISAGLLALFVYFDTKDFNLLKYHVPKKVFKIYFSGIILLAFDMVLTVVLMFCYQLSKSIDSDVYFIVCIILIALITLIAIGLYRYAKYKIDLSIYLRKHGASTNPSSESSNNIVDESASSSITDAIKK